MIFPPEKMKMQERNTRTKNTALDGRTLWLESTQQTTEEEDGTVTWRSATPARSHVESHINCELHLQRCMPDTGKLVRINVP